MNIQAVLDVPIVDSSGHLSAPWRDFLSQFFIQMQQNFSDEGYKLPQQTTLIITALNTAKSEGAIIYDKQLKKGFLNENGTFKEIVTS